MENRKYYRKIDYGIWLIYNDKLQQTFNIIELSAHQVEQMVGQSLIS